MHGRSALLSSQTFLFHCCLHLLLLALGMPYPLCARAELMTVLGYSTAAFKRSFDEPGRYTRYVGIDCYRHGR
jgi:hypothetical protein